MKIEDYQKIIQLRYVGGGFIPYNHNAKDLENECKKNEIISFVEITQRDLKFHKCYFDLLGTIYDYLPDTFQQQIKKDNFYEFLKHLSGNYKILYRFKDGTSLIKYDSISFGNMSQKRFEAFVRNQITFIYNNVLGAFFEGEILNNIIKTIEEDYKTFLGRL